MQQPAMNHLEATKPKRVEVAQQLLGFLERMNSGVDPITGLDAQTLILQALEHYGDIASKQQLSQITAQKNLDNQEVKSQNVQLVQDKDRLNHDK